MKKKICIYLIELTLLVSPAGQLNHAACADLKDSRDTHILLFQNAYNDYTAGKYDVAYNGFKSFIEKYPAADIVSNAQFYLGECFYSRKMWIEAAREYEKVENIYSAKPDLISAAKLRAALCYENLGLKEEALKLFSLIVEEFPNSSASLTAKEKVKSYTDTANAGYEIYPLIKDMHFYTKFAYCSVIFYIIITVFGFFVNVVAEVARNKYK
ncbi:MAG: tetratricopeptide repeat protein [Endomicrobium sp.]|jgi:tetratricopeptide (TPR) repeat protein|nr:tetratricopeptide repeat protein [Endomicrobium sp.]